MQGSSWKPSGGPEAALHAVIGLEQVRNSDGRSWKPLGWPRAALIAVVGLEQAGAGHAGGEVSPPVLSNIQLAHFLLHQATAMHEALDYATATVSDVQPPLHGATAPEASQAGLHRAVCHAPGLLLSAQQAVLADGLLLLRRP